MINRLKVLDAYVLVRSSSVKIPVASFTVSYELDQLPTASIKPALGRSLGGSTIWSLSDIAVDEDVSLMFNTDGNEIELLRGYIQTKTTQTVSQFQGAQTSNSIIMVHRAARIAGSPFGSFTYLSAMTSLIISRNNKFHMGMFGEVAAGGAADYVQLAKGLYDTAASRNGLWPTNVIKDMVVRVLEKNYPASYMTEASEFIQAYEPANFGTYAFNVIRIYQALHGAFVRSVPSSNLWTGMAQACASMFLHIVPSASKIHIANPMATYNVPAVTITSSEYSGFSAALGSVSSDPVDHVVVKIFDKGTQDFREENYVAGYAAFPPFRDANGKVITDMASVKGIPKGLFCHWRNAPSWVSQATAQGVTLADRTKTPNSKTLKGKTLIDESAVTIGQRLAEMYYASIKGRSMQSPQLTIPFRTDVMPGTIVRIDGVDTDSIGSSQLYGMVKAVRLSCGGPDNPGLYLQVTLDSARTAEDNATFDEGGIGIAVPGLFEGAWPGIDIEGNYLSDLPSHQAFPGRTSSSVADRSGQISDSAG